MHRSWTSAKRLWGDGGRCLSEPLQDRGLAGLQVCARPLAAGRNGRSGETGRRGRSLCHGGPSSIRRCSADLARESIKHSVIKHSATRGVRTVPPPLSTGTCGVLVAFCIVTRGYQIPTICMLSGSYQWCGISPDRRWKIWASWCTRVHVLRCQSLRPLQTPERERSAEFRPASVLYTD